ncbi:MAG: LLM class F420-dependent oxidoreductase [Geodermatophilaceae bacterium]|nr:LLM class F420-dependent oxidoreductase [Geodermatophilaceae bacterium]
MRLGLNLGYWGAGNDKDNLLLAREADMMGYSVVWAAEAYGSDVPTVLAFVAAQTQRIDVGAAIMQIPARTPAMSAMTAATLDTLSDGRFRMGLGVSGPQVSEGWHGVRFDKPLGRTREYVEIVRMALARQRVRYDGVHYVLPLPDGPGKALTLTVHPARNDIPIYLAAVGPRNLELTGEIADGWLAIFFSPEHSADQLAAIQDGRRRGGRTSDFDVVPTVPICIADDLQAAADVIRPYCALYVGGMGSREKNFYNAQARRMGFEVAASAIQDHYLNRDYAAAAAAVPFEFIDGTALIGPVGRIAERMTAYADAGVTTITVAVHHGGLEQRLATLRGAVEALELSGQG